MMTQEFEQWSKRSNEWDRNTNLKVGFFLSVMRTCRGRRWCRQWGERIDKSGWGHLSTPQPAESTILHRPTLIRLCGLTTSRAHTRIGFYHVTHMLTQTNHCLHTRHTQDNRNICCTTTNKKQHFCHGNRYKTQCVRIKHIWAWRTHADSHPPHTRV